LGLVLWSNAAIRVPNPAAKTINYGFVGGVAHWLLNPLENRGSRGSAACSNLASVQAPIMVALHIFKRGG